MNPKEEAKRLYHIFLTCQPDKYLAKQATLFCVDEIMKNGRHFITKKSAKAYGHDKDQSTEYWQEVKHEIEKL